MSFLMSQQTPAKVFMHSDVGAPVLTSVRTPNRIISLIKTCLTEGYGTTDSAGWTSVSNVEGSIYNLTPPTAPDIKFTVNLTNDDGRQLTPIMYTDMTSLTEGERILQCSTEFKYDTSKTTGKWLLVATDIGFWFMCEVAASNGVPSNKSGSYFYCGATTKGTNSVSGLYMTHTGGSWSINDDDRGGIFNTDSSSNATPQFSNPNTKASVTEYPKSMFKGDTNYSLMTMGSTVYIMNAGEIWRLPVLVPSRTDSNNYDIITDGDRQYICHGTSAYSGTNLIYIPIDYWEY